VRTDAWGSGSLNRRRVRIRGSGSDKCGFELIVCAAGGEERGTSKGSKSRVECDISEGIVEVNEGSWGSTHDRTVWVGTSGGFNATVLILTFSMKKTRKYGLLQMIVGFAGVEVVKRYN